MKVKAVLEKKQSEEAVTAIDEILSPIYDNSRGNLTQHELNFCYIEELERQINSGGFNSYFYYSYGNYVFETIQALELIGSTVYTGILKEAVAVFGDDYTVDEMKRSDIIDENEDEYDEKWELLDERFYEYSENIHKLLLNYVSENISSYR